MLVHDYTDSAFNNQWLYLPCEHKVHMWSQRVIYRAQIAMTCTDGM